MLRAVSILAHVHAFHARILRRLPLLILLCAIAAPLHAQWVATSPNLLGHIPYWGGSIVYHDGIVWAGETGLWKSLDSGKTWTNVLPNGSFKNPVVHIAFYDTETGLVAVRGTGVYRTTDGGLTWNMFSNVYASNVGFGSSVNEQYVTESYGATFYHTVDGGANWSAKLIDDFLPGFVVRPNGHLYLFSGNSNTRYGSIYTSFDHGGTWMQQAGTADWDSYSMTIDSCNESLVYLVNENQVFPLDDLSAIYASQNGGATWQIPLSYQGFYFSGSIETSGNAVYAQTLSNGIVRSTDQGSTFRLIGGPSANGDTRTFCTISDNLLLAADSDGTIWRTTNSGGDSITSSPLRSTLSIDADAQNPHDTIVTCDTVLRYVFRFHNVSCVPNALTSATITGADRGAYQLSGTTHTANFEDSLVVLLVPRSSQAYRASLTLSFSAHTSVSLPLDIVIRRPAPSLTISDSVLFGRDTIGSCDLPIADTITIVDHACIKRRIIGSTIAGAFASRYTSTILANDSVRLNCTGGTSNDLPADLMLTLSDSTQLHLALRAHGRPAFSFSTLAPPTLFATDTIQACDPPRVNNVILRDSSCPTRTIVRQSIFGSDSSAYTLTRPFDSLRLKNDTAIVELLGTIPGSHTASLVVQFSDGSSDTIALFGVVRRELPVRVLTENIFVDTLGATAHVPIRVEGLQSGDSIRFDVSFDTTMMEYLGIVDSNGAVVAQVSRALHAHVTAQIHDTATTFFALFAMFPTDSACTTVAIDSIDIVRASSHCPLGVIPSLHPTICTNLGCGVATLSRFLRYRKMPEISVVPNPASSIILLSSTIAETIEAELIDLRGHSVKREACTIGPSSNASIEIRSLPDGAYILVLGNANARESRLVIKR